MGPKNVLAWFGELHPAVLDAIDVAGPLVGFEVLVDNIPTPKAKATTTRPPFEISNQPVVERDFAFLVDSDVAADQVVRAARGADKDLITEVTVFDVYQGERIGAERKSLAIAVRLEPRERTLTDADIEAVSRKVVDRVGKATGGMLRD